MWCGFHFDERSFDHSGFINKKCHPMYTLECTAHKFFFSPNSECFRYFMLFIQQQRKRKLKFFNKLLMGLCWISWNPKDFYIFIFEEIVVIFKTTCLSRTSWCIVPWIKIKKILFSQKFFWEIGFPAESVVENSGAESFSLSGQTFCITLLRRMSPFFRPVQLKLS